MTSWHLFLSFPIHFVCVCRLCGHSSYQFPSHSPESFVCLLCRWPTVVSPLCIVDVEEKSLLRRLQIRAPLAELMAAAAGWVVCTLVCPKKYPCVALCFCVSSHFESCGGCVRGTCHSAPKYHSASENHLVLFSFLFMLHSVCCDTCFCCAERAIQLFRLRYRQNWQIVKLERKNIWEPKVKAKRMESWYWGETTACIRNTRCLTSAFDKARTWHENVRHRQLWRYSETLQWQCLQICTMCEYCRKQPALVSSGRTKTTSHNCMRVPIGQHMCSVVTSCAWVFSSVTERKKLHRAEYSETSFLHEVNAEERTSSLFMADEQVWSTCARVVGNA